MMTTLRSGRSGDRIDSVLYVGREVCQPCILVQCEVRGQGNACEVYKEYSVRERERWFERNGGVGK